ncbi:MAG: HlyD family efflux transporter periplasmic adaptor subunit [Tannerella sp.]|jgi:HlyD family secretion protein|nr:HlyD family efflux transporter periplasmic adaptor subunit [Tannerella sp.]
MKTAVKLSSIVCTIFLIISCGNNKDGFDATGTFEATEITVSSEASGRILSFDITEGQEVIAGQKLGAIDSMQLYLTKLQLLKNASSVASNRPNIEVQIAALKEQIIKQKNEQKRFENLFNAKVATQKQLDDVNSAVAVLERQLAALQSSLQNNISSLNAQSSAIEIQIAQIEDKLSKCIIQSPVSGTILNKYTEAGELAVTGKALFKVADTRNFFLRAYMTLEQLKDVKIGQKVKVYADFGRDNRREYEGAITWISEKSEFTPKNIQTKDERANLVYAVKIAIENDGYVKIGMYGEIIL